MSVILMRNKAVEVEPLSDGTQAVYWRLADDLLDLCIKLVVKPPDLDIISAEANVIRSPHNEGVSASELIKKIVGVRVGPGLRKIVRGLMGGADANIELTEGILECCNAVILNLTRPNLQSGIEVKSVPEEELIETFRTAIKSNPSLKSNCIAFANDSPIMQ